MTGNLPPLEDLPDIAWTDVAARVQAVVRELNDEGLSVDRELAKAVLDFCHEQARIDPMLERELDGDLGHGLCLLLEFAETHDECVVRLLTGRPYSEQRYHS